MYPCYEERRPDLDPPRRDPRRDDASRACARRRRDRRPVLRRADGVRTRFRRPDAWRHPRRHAADGLAARPRLAPRRLVRVRADGRALTRAPPPLPLRLCRRGDGCRCGCARARHRALRALRRAGADGGRAGCHAAAHRGDRSRLLVARRARAGERQWKGGDVHVPPPRAPSGPPLPSLPGRADSRRRHLRLGAAHPAVPVVPRPDDASPGPGRQLHRAPARFRGREHGRGHRPRCDAPRLPAEWRRRLVRRRPRAAPRDLCRAAALRRQRHAPLDAVGALGPRRSGPRGPRARRSLRHARDRPRRPDGHEPARDGDRIGRDLQRRPRRLDRRGALALPDDA